MIDRRRLLAAFGGIAAGAALPTHRAAAAQAERIVIIHGCCHPDRSEDQNRAEWMPALRDGAAAAGLTLPDDIEFVFPFYGRALGDWVDRFDVNATSTITSKGNASQDEYLQFQLDLAEEMLDANDIPLSAVEENYDGTSTDKGFANWEWVQAILRTLEQRNDRLAQSALDVFTRDVFLYLNKDVVRRDINHIVDSYLDDRPTIVVAHSLGTIVAYDVLRTRPRDVPLFMTLGSPLGIRTIRIRLTPLSFPGGVARWENYYDDRDPIALYPLDAANFGVVPEIPNVSDIKNQTDNRHGIVGYLSRPRVVQGILS